MNPRERFRATLLFDKVDRVPFSPGGPRESTRARWHKEGLPEGVNYMDAVRAELGIEAEKTQPQVGVGVSFQMIPMFEEKVLEHKDGHYIVQDWKGNICEIADTFDVTYLRQAKDFVTRRWIKCPVERRDDWEQMKERYKADDPERFPIDFADRCAKLKERDYPAVIHFNGPFWQLREWLGFEGLCIMMAEDPAFVVDMCTFWRDFIVETIKPVLASVELDCVGISEDMAYKQFSMISPAMARRFLQPCYDAWAPMIKASGCPIIDMDSDGFIGELIPIWIESGINVCDPIEVAAGNDIVAFRKQFGRDMGYRGGIDKRCIAKGGKVIEDELNRIIPPLLKDGGFIPSCDHGVPHDISWPNFLHYCRLLARHTGWL